MSLGSIIIDLLMRTGSFSTDTDRATKDLKKLKKEAYDTGKTIGDSLGKIAAPLGLALTVAGLTAIVKNAIDAADHLNDLSKKTGISVDTLGGLGFAAGQAGGDLESVAAAAGKLNKTLAQAAAGNKEQADIFRTIGVAVTDLEGRTRSADLVMADVADRFAEWQDGPEKAAIALALFGKAGADIIPLLNDGGRALRQNIAYYKLYAGVTQETATAADNFNDTLGKLGLLTGAFGRSLSAELLGPLQAVADRMLEAKENGDQFRSVAHGLVEVFTAVAKAAAFVASYVHIVGDAIGQLAAQAGVLLDVAEQAKSKQFQGIDVFGSGAAYEGLKDAIPKLRAISEAATEERDRTRKSLEGFYAALEGKPQASGFNDRRFETGRPGVPKAPPRLPAKGAADQAGQEAIKAYDAQIKAARDFAAQQKATFDYANRLLDSTFDDGLTSLRDYFAQQQAIRDAAVSSQLRAVDAEIAVRKKEANDSRLNPVQRLDATNKLAEAEQHRSEVVVAGARSNVLAYESERKAVSAYADRLIDLQAQIAEGAGDTQLAASLRMSRQIADAQRTVAAVGAHPSIVGKLQQQLQTRADLSKAQEDYAKLIERARNAEDAAAIDAQSAGKNELDTLRDLGTVRQRALAQMQEMVDKANELALASGGNPAAIQFAEQLGAAFKRAAAEAAPVLLHIREVAQEAGKTIADSLADAALEGKGFLDTLHDLDRQLAKIALNELFTKPAQQWFANLLGGTGTAGSAGGAGSGWIGAAGGWLAGLFGGGMAEGGATAPNTLYNVAERGPEVFDDGRHQWLLTGAGRGRIDPHPQQVGATGRSVMLSQTFVLPNRIDKRTQQQTGAETARVLARANLRGN